MKLIDEWKDVVLWEAIYEVSNVGQIRGKKTGKIRKHRVEKLGYCSVDLWDKGNMKRLKVHRMVAQAFLPNPEDKPQVNHKDGNKENNCVDNLEWCTAKENSVHACSNGLSKAVTGERHGMVKLTELEAAFIKQCSLTNTQAALEFGVSSRLVRKIRAGHLWKHIKNKCRKDLTTLET